MHNLFLRVSALCVFALAIVVLPAQAQEAGDLRVVADVNIQNALIVEANGHEVIVEFNVSNNDDKVQPQVRYSIALDQKADDGTIRINEKVFDEVLSLNPGQIATRQVTYDIPKSIAGEYTVVLNAQNNSGLPLAIAEVGEVTLEKNNGYADIDVQSCNVQVGEDLSNFGIVQGVDVTADEKITVHCDVYNRAAAGVAYAPEYKTHERTIFGKLIDTKRGDPISLEEGKNVISFDIPEAQKPQAYDVSITLLNDGGEAISNDVNVHYVLSGDSATIQNIRLDKDAYKAGEVAIVDVEISGRADVFENARLQNADAQSQNTVSVSIKGTTGACGSATGSDSDLMVKVKIDKDCADPKVSVIVKNQGGDVLDKKDFAVMTGGIDHKAMKKGSTGAGEEKSLFSKALLAVLALTVLIIVVILIRSSHKAKNITKVLVFGAFVGSSILFASSAEAKTFYLPGQDGSSSKYVIANLNKSTVTQCETGNIQIAGKAKMTACQNTPQWILEVRVDGGTVQKIKSECYDRYFHHGGTKDNCGNYGGYWDDGKCWSNTPKNTCSGGTNSEQTLNTEHVTPSKALGTHNIPIELRVPQSSTTAVRNWSGGNLTYTVVNDGSCDSTVTIAGAAVPNTCAGDSGSTSNGQATITLSAGGTATGTKTYRYKCGSQAWTAYKSASTHTCNFPTSGTKRLYGQAKIGVVVSAQVSKTVVIPTCAKNGACGTRHTKTGAWTTADLGRYSMCDPGAWTYTPLAKTKSPVRLWNSSTQRWEWTCKGVSGGTDSGTCWAEPIPVNGVCNSTYNGQQVATIPGADRCTTGSPTAVTGTGGADNPWKWNCNDRYITPNTPGVCTALKLCPAGQASDPVTGVCGCDAGTTSDPANPGQCCTDVNNNGQCDAICTPPMTNDPANPEQCQCPDNTVECNGSCIEVNVTGGNAELSPTEGQCPGGPIVGVSANGCNADLYCKVYNTDTKYLIGQGTINESGSIQIGEKAVNVDACSITEHAPDNIKAVCSTTPDDNDEDDDDDDDTVNRKASVQCVCTATRCSDAGTCQAIPIVATSYDPALCTNECTVGNNASCGGGGTRETGF